MKKIPDNARLVFKGLIFDVYHWEQELFDGTKATFEAVRRIGSVNVIPVIDNRIVLVEEMQPNTTGVFVGTPGGRMEPNENALESAKRELLEETGIESSEWVEWFTVDAANTNKLEWLTHYYIAKDCKMTKNLNLDSGEKVKTKLVTLDEFINLKDSLSGRNSELKNVFQKMIESTEEKQKLRELLGITNE